MKTGKACKVEFPLITLNISSKELDDFITTSGIEVPLLYRLGFNHNNCSGGCVRAGKKQWKLLYEKLPEVFLDRERVENEVSLHLGKDVHFFKDETLANFRGRIERGELSSHYDADEETGKILKFFDKDDEFECFGVCDSQC